MADSGATSVAAARRITLDDLELSPGKYVRLQRLLYGYGPGNGTMMLLPVDHGMEHGPVDFFDNPAALDPDYIWRLALEGGFSGVALQYGTALKYMRQYAGAMPLVVKLNGKTNIPPDDDPLNPLNATVEDAVRLGADAIGYTLYMGSSRQDEDFAQWRQVRQDADRFGMPTIMWAYPRGRHMEAKGGRDSFYAIDYAARVAAELGADVVKINVPKIDPEKDKLSPAPYDTMNVTAEEALAKAVQSAGKTLVLISGSSRASDDEALEKARLAVQSGATGFIFGRNCFQRPWDEGLALVHAMRDMLRAAASE